MDYPDYIKEAAQKAVKWAEENGWGDCGTQVGKVRAHQLANGEPISLDTVKRMYSFLARHRQNYTGDYTKGCGSLMVDAWGGLKAYDWAKRTLEREEKEKLTLNFEKLREYVKSSNIDRIMYDTKKRELVVKFHNGEFYTYFNVPENIFDDIADGVDAPITSGSNQYGTWTKGVRPSSGATLYRRLRLGGYGYTKGGSFR